MKFYLVTTKCGHVGKTSFMPITFPVKAENGKEAARLAREFPRVKHNHWDAILECHEVDAVTYYEQVAINCEDPYLSSRSKQEQDAHADEIYSRVREDKHQEEINQSKRKSKRPNLSYQRQKYGFIDRSYQFEAAMC